MASIAMIIPLVNELTNQNGTGPTFVYLDWLFSGIPFERRLYFVVSLFSTIFVIKNIALFLLILVINKTLQRKLAIFNQRMFAAYLHQPLSFHLKQNSAEIIRNLHTSSARAFESVRVILMLVLEFMLVVVALVLLLIVEPLFTLIAAAGLLSFGLLFYRIAGPKFQRWGQDAQTIEGQMIKIISESLGSIRDIKLLNIQKYMEGLFALQTNNLAKNLSRVSTSQHIPRLSVETLVILGFAGVVVGLMIVKGSFDEAVASLGLFAMASLRLMPSMNRILNSMADLKNRLASVDLLYDDLKNARNNQKQNYADSLVKDLPFVKEIRMDNLTFSYSKIDVAAITNVSLCIKCGCSIGIVGPSGAGKSTLLDLLLGMLEPQEGQITVDGINIKNNLGSWRKHLGYVPQNVFLVDEPLRQNIAFGVIEERIDERRIAVAVKLSNLTSVVEKLENGLETRLGQGGSRLSGGQRQRVAIARALYRDPKVLIFDEATSSLDVETEREVTAAIDRLKGEKTIIIISHKLSIVGRCNEVVFMEDGKIVDIGSLDNLITNNLRFQEFAHGEGALFLEE
ncbi:ABC transporter ATP-binding protein/permease [Rhodospirillales bacterium]|nr:ABC transporter ATP-binding protein/permease [Rhodospirillales bacterium]